MKKALCIASGSLLLVSLLTFSLDRHWLGLVGKVIGATFIYTFGLASYGIAILLLVRPKKRLFAAIFICATSLTLAVSAERFPKLAQISQEFVFTRSVTYVAPIAHTELRTHLGGAPFTGIYRGLLKMLLSPIGTLAFSGAISAGSLLILTWRKRPPKPKKPIPIVTREEPIPEIGIAKAVEEKIIAPPPMRRRPTSSKYTLPSPNILTQAQKHDSSGLKAELRKKAEVLEETLASFGIEASVVDINCGPSIASFEVQPAIGVKVQRIKALESDLALNMQARSIRILAPIPGKAAVGIEVPSPIPQEVSFREMLLAYGKSGKRLGIPVFLGKAVNGDDVTADLTKMPHGIIAGATGSGKSVCVNSIIMSILMTARPDEVRLLMIDPKKVELTPYTHLPHMIAPVITEPAEACTALNWLVREMEQRYDYLKRVGARHILGFNGRKRKDEDEDIPEHLPYIVGIIDELADLMMASSADIETPITRIAQMARAVGIHLIIATQRPSREVITGLIKANFPTRLAFKVASRINSQIILDDTGAETLLGNGDMLFLPPGSSALVRAQGSYVRDEDIHKAIEHICSQAPTDYLIESFAGGAEDPTFDTSGRDDLYDKALQLVRMTGTASTTYIQRKLKLGYARAASIMDRFEEEGIVGPQEGSKPRKVLK